MEGKFWQLRTMFLGFEAKIGWAENFVQFKIVHGYCGFPIIFPIILSYKISLGLFGPIFPWSRELIAAKAEPKRFEI